MPVDLLGDSAVAVGRADIVGGGRASESSITNTPPSGGPERDVGVFGNGRMVGLVGGVASCEG